MNISESDKNKILKIYHDPELGYSSPADIYKKLNKSKSITLKKIKFILDNFCIDYYYVKLFFCLFMFFFMFPNKNN